LLSLAIALVALHGPDEQVIWGHFANSSASRQQELEH
jgi:hypothetical protein